MRWLELYLAKQPRLQHFAEITPILAQRVA
jgi:hypothetical protein